MVEPAPVDALLDRRPIAIRRKRRAQGATLKEGASAAAAALSVEPNPSRSPRKAKPVVVVSTPRRKRVRFSEPCPDGPSSLATGLTPALLRHGLDSSSAIMPSCSGISSSRRTKRRQSSSPLKHTSTLAPPPLMGTLQFESLRQVIDGRSRRRIRRNRLSEEMNKIDEEKKHELKLNRKLVAVERKLVDGGGKPVDEAGAPFHTPQQTCSQMICAVDGGISKDDAFWVGAAIRSFEDFDYDNMSATSTVDLGLDATELRQGPATQTLTGSESHVSIPRGEVADTGTQANLVDSGKSELEEQVRVLKESLRTVTLQLELSNTTNQRVVSKLRAHLQDSGSFSSNPSEVDEALDTVLTSLVLAQSRAEDAEAGLSALSSEIKGLGFDGDDVQGTLKAINSQFRQARLELEYLQPGETVEGFENARLLGLLVDRVRLLLQRIRDSGEERDEQRRVSVVLQKQFDHSEARRTAAQARVHELAVEVEEKERSISNLQRALDGYRSEVNSLENLVNRLEAEHATTTEGLHKTLDEAVADLEGKLEAEVQSREGVTREVQEKKHQVEMLQNQVERNTNVIERLREEKASLLAAKDEIVSKLETRCAEKDKAHELDLSKQLVEIKSLEREKSNLVESLAEAEISIGTVAAANTMLEKRLASDLEAGGRAMEAMQMEMMRSLARVAEIKNTFLNSGRVPVDDDGVALPATPCSLRFRNTPKKKRRKVDSGIGVLEEDEEMPDA